MCILTAKVTFIYMHQCKEYEVNGEIEKEVSHQVIMIQCPGNQNLCVSYVVTECAGG
jgi:hypothetical protein